MVYDTCEARRVQSAHMQSTPIDITRVLLNIHKSIDYLSHASEKSLSNMAVHAYKITRVSAESSAHAEFLAQREQYSNSFKCTYIFFCISLFTERHSTNCVFTAFLA